MLYTISDNSVVEELTVLWQAACQLRYILVKTLMKAERSQILKLNLRVIGAYMLLSHGCCYQNISNSIAMAALLEYIDLCTTFTPQIKG